MNSYDLSRNFFDFCFDNPEKINTSHVAIYFFAIEHCNRLGWKKKFGFPTQMVMDAVGIKKPHTYIKYFNNLVEWEFFHLIQKSKNQYSSNIISLSSATPETGRALGKAVAKHAAEHGQSMGRGTGSINKPRTLEPNNKEQERERARVFFDESIKDIFEEHNALDEYKKFCEYWLTTNQHTDKIRFQEDAYFNPALKARSWLDKSGAFDGDHIHKEFIDLWIIKTSPTQSRINAVKSYLAGKKSLKTSDIINQFQKDISRDIFKIVTIVERTENTKRNNVLQSFPLEEKKETSDDELKVMRNLMNDEEIAKKCPELIPRLKEVDNKRYL
ncbi:MAG: hypothetical protein NE328_19170 [Lentisphaeraceae bacterium]|nr:hypothetical protein [Lentisphaeraceae bacterium]